MDKAQTPSNSKRKPIFGIGKKIYKTVDTEVNESVN
jgi:hypothetical protein